MDDKDFLLRARAVKHFQKGKDFDKSQKILATIYKTAKFRGHCKIFTQLLINEIKHNKSRSKKIDYDLAHCFQISGQYLKALKITEKNIFKQNDNEFIRIGFVRLHAELLGNIGRPEDGIKLLTQDLENPTWKNSKHYFRSKGVLGQLFILHNDLSSARSVLDRLFNFYEEIEDCLGQAITITRLGIIDEKTDELKNALKKLQKGNDMFQIIGDERGLAWNTIKLTKIRVLQKLIINIPLLKKAILTRAREGSLDEDYLNDMAFLYKTIEDQIILSLLQGEINRIKESLSIV